MGTTSAANLVIGQEASPRYSAREDSDATQCRKYGRDELIIGGVNTNAK